MAADDFGPDDVPDEEVVEEVPIEEDVVEVCAICDNTGAVPAAMHLDANNNVVVDKYKDCSCGIVGREREEAKKVKE